MGFPRVMPMMCSGLKALEIAHSAQYMGDRQRRLCLVLKDAACLERCVIRVRRAPVCGDSIRVKVACSGSVYPHAECVERLGGKLWELRFEVGHDWLWRRLRRAQVTWTFGTQLAPNGWHIDVCS